MNYTKGTWYFGLVNLPDKDAYFLIKTDKHTIAKISNLNDGFETEANAELIAASPRMIEFIQQLAREGNVKAQKFIKTLA